LKVQKEFGSFNKYIWSYVNYKPITNSWNSEEEVPAKTELSEVISKDLKKRGFNFLGPVIIYSYLQAVGIINDHIVKCYMYKDISKMDFKFIDKQIH
jgi:DNA-3-methyladenine glycosylase I